MDAALEMSTSAVSSLTRPLHRAAQPIRVGEIQRSRFHQAAEGLLQVRVTRQSPCADALVEPAPDDYRADRTERPSLRTAD